MLETLHGYFSYYPEVVWMCVGAVFLIIEVTVIPGIGLVFVGLGALTLSGLMAFKLFSADSAIYKDLYAQLGCVLAFTTVWAAALWAPLKKLQERQRAAKYQDFVGQTAFVGPTRLLKGRTGTVKWSGVAMRARLIDDAEVKELAPFEEVTIVDMQGGTLVVKPMDRVEKQGVK